MCCVFLSLSSDSVVNVFAFDAVFHAEMVSFFWIYFCTFGILPGNNVVLTKSLQSQIWDDGSGGDINTVFEFVDELEESNDFVPTDYESLSAAHDLDEIIKVNETGKLDLCPQSKGGHIGKLRLSTQECDRPPTLLKISVDLSPNCLLSSSLLGLEVYLNIRELNLAGNDTLTVTSGSRKKQVPKTKYFTAKTTSILLEDWTDSFGQIVVTELPFEISLHHTTPSFFCDHGLNTTRNAFVIDYSLASKNKLPGYTCHCPMLGAFLHGESLQDRTIISCPKLWHANSSEPDPSGPYDFRCQNVTLRPDPCCPLSPTSPPVPTRETVKPTRTTPPSIWPPRPPSNPSNTDSSVSIVLGVTAGVLFIVVVIFAIVTYRVRLEQSRTAMTAPAISEHSQTGWTNGGMAVTEDPPPLYGAPPTYAEAMQNESIVILSGFDSGGDEETGENNTIASAPLYESVLHVQPDTAPLGDSIREDGAVNAGFQLDETSEDADCSTKNKSEVVSD
ncbi:uncharacterized protein LOC129584019 [Paramacrobiotus metropolitanus]|uniref:uncharacterized protein LOC129584019 n=1 Tax=Paramacrobiotus metropolitanus TaxID=2943436 RepID=UPI002445ECDC|nr:uncharacterized protein LOC129584019 [Paramacrobiotus metropolitanus]